jgi:hypothetical protein
MNKFGAKKTEVAGIVFDSKAEARRYGQLIMLERSGAIAGLTRQVPFVLAKSVKFAGAPRAKPAMKYIADFVYTDTQTGKIVVEDVKGMKTALFQAKRHWMLAIHGIDLRLTK